MESPIQNAKDNGGATQNGGEQGLGKPSKPKSVLPSQEENVCLYNGKTETQLKDMIEHETCIQKAIKILFLSLFGKDYLIVHSITGKASNKATPLGLGSSE